MRPPEIMALGKFYPNDLIVTISESNRKIEPSVEDKVDAIWDREKSKAEKAGRVCYNGINYRVNSFKISDEKIYIDFGTIEYKTRMSLIEIPEYFNLSPEYYRKGCFSGASVKTSDDMYVMVELSGKSMNTNKLDILGGLIEKPLEIMNNEDVFKTILEEMQEEGSIEKEDIKDLYLRTVYLTPRTDVGFYFEVILKTSSTELLSRFEAKNKDADIKSIKFFKKEDYIDELQKFNESKKMLSKLLLI